MADRYCGACSSIVPGTSRFCPNCGAPMPERRPAPTWGTHPAWRFQVDPNDPPYRDARWIQLVVGFSLATIGGFLLLVGAILSGVSVPGAVFRFVFLVPGAICLVVGLALVLVALYRTLGRP